MLLADPVIKKACDSGSCPGNLTDIEQFVLFV